MNPDLLRLYLVTDPVLCRGRGVEETVRQALEAGVRAVQLRDKNASIRDLLLSAEILRELCAGYGALFVVNDRVDVALAVSADGVHLGQDDMPAATARTILGPDAVIGVSVRSGREASDAERAGADYMAANMVFPTSTKNDIAGPPLGLKVFPELRAAAPRLPLVAIGGINGPNASLLWEAGVDGIAVVSAVMAASDVASAVAGLIRR